MAHENLLLNNGDNVLLNDGLSLVLLNGTEVTGIHIGGEHAVADLRGIAQKKKPKLISPALRAVGKISKINIFSGSGRLFRKKKLTAESRITKIIESNMVGRVWKSYKLWMESMVFSNNKIKLPISDVEKQLKENLKRAKLRKLMKEFKKEFD